MHYSLCFSPPSVYRIQYTLSSHLILPRHPLAVLQLLQIPIANLHIPAILIQALCKVLGVQLARRHPLAIVRLTSLLRRCGRGRGLLRRRRGPPAAEEPADRVADGGADCDAAVWR